MIYLAKRSRRCESVLSVSRRFPYAPTPVHDETSSTDGRDFGIVEFITTFLMENGEDGRLMDPILYLSNQNKIFLALIPKASLNVAHHAAMGPRFNLRHGIGGCKQMLELRISLINA